jgi:hypothetical protein
VVVHVNEKNESLAYNPLRGRIVLHTACDKEVATFASGSPSGNMCAANVFPDMALASGFVTEI